MQITIVVDDQTILCDGVAVKMPALDWGRFDGDPASAWDNIRAVQFDSVAGQGHVEYRPVKTLPPVRPDIKPGDWRITSADFEANFAWVLPLYAEAKAKQEAAAEAARVAAEKTAADAIAAEEAARRLAVERASLPRDPNAPVEAAAAEDVEAMRAELAQLRATVAAHSQTFEAITKL